MTSKTTVLSVVIGLVIITLALVATILLLRLDGQEVPGEVYALAGTALGGLIGVLSNTRSTLGSNDVEPTMVSGMVRVSDAAPSVAQDVNVVNAPSDPVPVDPQPPVEGLADPPERAR